MRRFIGTKIIEAELIDKELYCNKRGWDVPKDEDRDEEGYYIRYPDGYISWSPKEQFEKAYRNINKPCLNFCQALTLVKRGVSMGMARKNWNGKGMIVVYQPGYPEGIEVNENAMNAFNLIKGSKMKVRPHLQLLCADGSIAEWAPSGSDVIEEDWMLVRCNRRRLDVGVY
jgi:hypothetical protein